MIMRIPIAIIILTLSFITANAHKSGDRIQSSRDNYLDNKITAGEAHTLEIRNGTLWASGHNDEGQLGDGTTTNRTNPVQIGSAGDWVNVAAGESHSLAIKADGTLWAWGWNVYGQIGDSTNVNKLSPVMISNDSNWVDIAAGKWHSIGIKADGTIWGWGNGGYGAIGNGVHKSEIVPKQIGIENNWVTIASGFHTSYAIKADGTLWAWGNNSSFQLGINNNISKKYAPVKVDSSTNWISVNGNFLSAIALKADGTLWTWGGNAPKPVKYGSDTDWIAIDNGASHSFAIKSDGSLWGWGWNYYGQIGDSTTIDVPVPKHIAVNDKWVAVKSGYHFTWGINANGAVYVWGDNSRGQFGNGTVSNSLTPQKTHVTDEWLTVAGGGNHNIGIRADGTLWSWGMNTHGQLGNGTTTDTNIHVRIGVAGSWKQVAAGQFHSLAINSDGTLWAWGQNTYGQLGDSSNTNRIAPVQVRKDNKWVSICAGLAHSLGIKADGTLWAWGNNKFGELGDSTTTNRNTPVQVGKDNDWLSIAAGADFSIGIKSNGTLWAWGDNADGELGIGTFMGKKISPVQVGTDNNWVSVNSGTDHTIALKADGTVWAWGDDQWGQVGNNPPNRFQRTPNQVGTDNTWASLATGSNHSFGIKANGQLWTWGWNAHGQTGDGTYTNHNVLREVSGAPDWAHASGGGAHSIGIKTDRKMLCGTGENAYGQLGDATHTKRNIFNCVCTPSYIDGEPNNKVFCTKGNTYFAVNARYAIAYKWQVNDGTGWVSLNNDTTYSGTSADSLFLSNIDNTFNNYMYRCLITNLCNDTTISAAAQILFPQSLVISTQPVDTTICDSTEVMFWIGSADTITNYQWQVDNGTGWSNITNGTIYSGADADTLIINPGHTTLNNNNYRCIATTCALSDTSDAAKLTVNPNLKPQVSVSMFSIGNNIHIFTAIPLNGGSNPVYYWYRDSTLLKQGPEDTLKLTGLTLGDTIWIAMESSEQCVTAGSHVVNSNSITTNIATVNTLFTTINLYPNPNRGTFIITGTLTDRADNNMSLAVFSATGQQVYKENFISTNGKVRKSMCLNNTLSPGTYLIKISCSNGNFTRLINVIK